MRIEGIVDIKDNSAVFIAAVEAAAELALDAAGMQAASACATELQRSPSRIDTGLLKNSITWAVGGKSAAISSYSADRPSKTTGKMPPSGSRGHQQDQKRLHRHQCRVCDICPRRHKAHDS